MKNKNIYDILNKTDVEIPTGFENVSKKEIENYKKNFLKNINIPKKKSNWWIKFAIAAVFLIAFMGFTQPGQTIYAQIAGYYERMTNPIAEYSIEPEVVEESISRINSEVIQDGIRFELADAMLDENHLVVNMFFEVTGEDLINEFSEDANLVTAGWYTLLVNGKKINYSSGTIRGTIVDDKTHQQYFGFNLEDEISKEDVLTLVVDNVSVFNYDEGVQVLQGKPYEEVKTVEIPGEWTIDFSIQNSMEKLNTKVIEINRELINVNGYPVVFKDMKINAYRATMKLNYEKEAGILGKGIFFKAKDENDVEYEFMNFEAEQSSKTFRYYGEEGKDLMSAEKLTFQAYYMEDKEAEIYIPIGEPFEVNLKAN